MQTSNLENTTIRTVVPDPVHAGQVCVNGRYWLRQELYQAILSSSMSDDHKLAACLEAHYRRLLFTERSVERRHGLYAEAYSDLSRLNSARNQDNLGISDNFISYYMPLFRDAEVLELGCGCGLLLPQIASVVKRYRGLDASTGAIAVAESNNASLLNDSRSFAVCNLASSELPRGYSVIYSNDFFEHLHPDDLRPLLKRCFEALAPGGKLLAVVPNRLFGPFDISRNFVPLGAPCEALHLNEMSYNDFADELETAGFTSVRTNALGLGALLRIRRALGAELMLTVSARLKGRLESSGLGRSLFSKLLSLRAVIVIAEKQV